MPARKIQDEQEVLRWFEEGRTYAWMTEQYEKKYHIHTSSGMWGQFAARRGLDRRIVRDDDLIPWNVAPKHRWQMLVRLLRAEARRRAGFELSATDSKYLPGFLRDLEEQNAVVHYDPEIGFVLVPREPDDTDIIRRPKRVDQRSRRHNPGHRT